MSHPEIPHGKENGMESLHSIMASMTFAELYNVLRSNMATQDEKRIARQIINSVGE